MAIPYFRHPRRECFQADPSAQSAMARQAPAVTLLCFPNNPSANDRWAKNVRAKNVPTAATNRSGNVPSERSANAADRENAPRGQRGNDEILPIESENVRSASAASRGASASPREQRSESRP